MASKEAVISALRHVFDPEIPVNIYDLGLIYDVAIEGDKIAIKMTLTSQHCPAVKTLPETVRKKVADLEAVQVVEVSVVWEPAWTQAKISPEGKQILGIA